ncbi:MAG: hypothetical protein ACREOO_26375 [bacterium]
MLKFHLNKRTVLVAGLTVLLAWVAIDLYFPRRTDLREFDAEEVARLDTVMWRSYYDREPLKLFFQLAELLRSQFNLPFLRSYLVAFDAAKAAFVFKDGRNRTDYVKALPNLIDYYAAIRKVSVTPFDVAREAELELEWWIVHRERAQHQPGDLELALANAAAELYQMPAVRLMEYARLRTAAMNVRDTRAANGGVSSEDWTAIATLLRDSWGSLWREVR